VHSPDSIEKPSSQRGRQATEGWNSPARLTAQLNGGEGAGPSGWGAALGSGEALGPAYGERWGEVAWHRRSGGKQRQGTTWGLTGGRQRWGMDKRTGGVFFYSHALRGGNAGLHKEGEREVTARCGGRATGVHARSMAQQRCRSGSGLVWWRCGGRLSVRRWKGGEVDRGWLVVATWRAWASQRMVPMRCGARELGRGVVAGCLEPASRRFSSNDSDQPTQQDDAMPRRQCSLLAVRRRGSRRRDVTDSSQRLG
jgi:hypothetical protein